MTSVSPSCIAHMSRGSRDLPWRARLIPVPQRLREDDRPVDVISITAAREVESLRAAMRGGVVHYLIKPFLFATFEEKLLSYASARERMVQLGQAQQSDVDRIFGTLRSTRNEPLPKGLSDTTLDLIAQALRQSRSGLAAAAVADAAGVSRVTARRYLDHLCQVGKAELTMRYGSPGRPEHRYRLIACGDAEPQTGVYSNAGDKP